MQSYNKGFVGLFVTVHYNGQVEASMQGYRKGSVVHFMTVHYND
jgi:hypothetical protein